MMSNKSKTKDSILWIDDYHPKTNTCDTDEFNRVFKMLVRMSGDLASKKRSDNER